MVNCYREFRVAQARITPATAQEEIDRALRTCWLEKRPVYLQLPSDVAGVLTAPIMARSTLIRQPAIRDNSRAVSRISGRLSQDSSPAILLDAAADRFGLTELLVMLAEAKLQRPRSSRLPRKPKTPARERDKRHNRNVDRSREARNRRLRTRQHLHTNA